MQEEQAAEIVKEGIFAFLTTSNPFRSVLILIASLLVAYWLSNYVAKAIVKIAQSVARRTDDAQNEMQQYKLQQVETYLSVTIAAVRAIIVAVVGYVGWRVFSEGSRTDGANSAAAIGAGAFFIVFAGQTLGILLRDITAGAIMIIEKWFNVGDFIKVEPFWDVSGVVERLTLRSTKIRSLSGEIIWVHNQHITAVHMTPRGLRTLEVDIFVSDREKGEAAVKKALDAIPTGKTMLALPLRIKYTEKWGEGLWRIVVIGQTPPGREWLIEDYFVNSIIAIDKSDTPDDEKLIVHPPIARHADSVADRRFNRAVRVAKNETD